jgi:hypothetical protein
MIVNEAVTLAQFSAEIVCQASGSASQSHNASCPNKPAPEGLAANPTTRRAKKGIENEEVFVRPSGAVVFYPPDDVRGSIVEQHRSGQTPPVLLRQGEGGRWKKSQQQIRKIG